MRCRAVRRPRILGTVSPGSDPPSSPGAEEPSADADPQTRAEQAEPESADAPAGEPTPADETVDALLRRFLSLPPIKVAAPPPPDPLVDRNASTLPAPAKTPTLESFDQKLAEVEPLLAATRWEGVVEVLSKQETLPPPLALVYAIALKERGAEGDPERLAIRAVAALLCVPENSETALVVAKRLLRTNPVSWQRRRAPSAGVSIGIALAVAVLGALLGFLAGPGTPLFR